MSAFAAFHSSAPLPAAHGSARGFLATVLRRLAASPLDSAVLRALDAPSPVVVASPKSPHLHAHWRNVSGPDGTSRLEAGWHPDH